MPYEVIFQNFLIENFTLCQYPTTPSHTSTKRHISLLAPNNGSMRNQYKGLSKALLCSSLFVSAFIKGGYRLFHTLENTSLTVNL